MPPVKPVDTLELFPPLSQELLALLHSLTPADWARPTACGPWTVKDVVAHLLGGSVGRLSAPPEGEAGSPTALSYAELVDLIDGQNAAWVRAAQRVSTDLLLESLAIADARLYALFKSWPPDAPARIAVSWAGDTVSPVWFDVAREYTEKWLHQQHIREAVGRPLLVSRRWLFPVLDTFMRALPRAYSATAAPAGTCVSFRLAGAAGGDWTLRRESVLLPAWALYSGPGAEAAARATLAQDWAWRLFTKGVSPEQARPHLTVEGDPALAAPFLEMISIMA
jgi:uncharacterized protein (TIGR03083 family)